MKVLESCMGIGRKKYWIAVKGCPSNPLLRPGQTRFFTLTDVSYQLRSSPFPDSASGRLIFILLRVSKFFLLLLLLLGNEFFSTDTDSISSQLFRDKNSQNIFIGSDEAEHFGNLSDIAGWGLLQRLVAPTSSASRFCSGWLLRQEVPLFFLLLAQSANLFLCTSASPHTPTDGMARIFILTPMLKLGLELRSVQLHLFVGPYLRTLYRLSYRSHEEVLLVGFNESFVK